ncbi:MAG: prepilin-type N-terminal cleavage/methylation domain-containing protein [Candidatus Brocadiae bacterium]|nr:prepilin-type N-terminal cleavage/methylation domain-containing protein [Candidatus Brocadiia bacterium]
MRQKGFTMIEVVVAAIIIAILASITVPSLYRIQRIARENTAIANLRIINTSQMEFRSRVLVDQDEDDIGEFGLLGELSGSVQLRKLGKKVPKTYVSHVMSPNDTDRTFGKMEGYCFRIYLPGDTTTVTDNGTSAPVSMPVNANYQEHKFRAYAWPLGPKVLGCRAFAIDQKPDVYYTSNVTSTGAEIYKGSTGPAYNAAILKTASDNSQFPQRFQAGTGVDNQEWKALTN